MWDDVGLNIPKPLDLLQLYRSCGSALPSPRETVDVAVGDEADGNLFTQESQRQLHLSQQVCVYVCVCVHLNADLEIAGSNPPQYLDKSVGQMKTGHYRWCVHDVFVLSLSNRRRLCRSWSTRSAC